MATIKRIQGLKNIHVAKLTGTNTYSTPVAILGAKEISLELQFEETKMYADDAIDYMDFIFAGGSGTLSMTGLTASEYETLFGATVSGEEVTVSTNDVAPELELKGNGYAKINYGSQFDLSEFANAIDGYEGKEGGIVDGKADGVAVPTSTNPEDVKAEVEEAAEEG